MVSVQMITLTKFSKRTVVSVEMKSHSEQLPGMLAQVSSNINIYEGCPESKDR
jgi:hypothetical protein